MTDQLLSARDELVHWRDNINQAIATIDLILGPDAPGEQSADVVLAPPASSDRQVVDLQYRHVTKEP